MQNLVTTENSASSVSDIDIKSLINTPLGKTRGHSIVVVGAGPTGIRLVQNIIAQDANAHITLFGNESYAPYNRVQLTGVLARDVSRDNIDFELPTHQQAPGFTYILRSIVAIDKVKKRIIDNQGNHHYYDKLVLAVGARAYVPDINGNNLKGVYTFRNLKDTDSLYARLVSARHIVVIGGGLLGLEAAKALSKSNAKVTVVQQNPLLMNRQLDTVSSALLLKKIQSLGIVARLGSGIREVLGADRVTAVVTRDGEKILCDTVLFCTGIKPNIELAIQAKLAFGVGIQVNDQLETNEPNVFAIGECCEHDGITFGLVSPGYEQAAILADHLCGGNAKYAGSLAVARLKVIGLPLASIGDISENQLGLKISRLVYQNKKKQLYRKIVLKKGRLVGALSYGDWDEVPRIQEALKQNRYIPIWSRIFFSLTGNLWASDAVSNVAQWPESAIVCQCNRISIGDLLKSMDAGSTTLGELQKNTGAGTVCGSCKPLLAQLTSDNSSPVKDSAWLPILLFSLTSIVVMLVILLVPGRPVSDSVLEVSLYEKIWNDKLNKQITGFTLLGLILVGLFMSLRKRITKFSVGDYSWWRLLHVLTGVLCVVGLMLHTGMHLGENLNKLLVINFLAVIGVGALTGAAVAMGHKLGFTLSKRSRESFGWVHIILTWPLPVLVIIHVLSVYYF